MLPRLIKAEPRGRYEVWVCFEDGAQGVLDLEPELWGEVFEPLRDPEEFRKLRLDEELGTVVWPNGADFAPEFLYQGLRPEFQLRSEPRTTAA
jgi:hypothetical protein